MRKEILVRELKNRQLRLGMVDSRIIDDLSDQEIISAYLKCCHCGEWIVSIDQAQKIIKQSRNTEEFLELTASANRENHINSSGVSQ